MATVPPGVTALLAVALAQVYVYCGPVPCPESVTVTVCPFKLRVRVAEKCLLLERAEADAETGLLGRPHRSRQGRLIQNLKHRGRTPAQSNRVQKARAGAIVGHYQGDARTGVHQGVGNDRVDPFDKVMVLFVLGSVYATEKVGEEVAPAKLPVMVVPLMAKLNDPLKDPACVGVNVI